MGTYVLALWLAAPQTIRVGRLGEFRFPAGWYLYAGSALGPGGLKARLARHLRRVGNEKQTHWHIDYLRERATWGGAWGRASGKREECAWASALCRLPGARIEVPGFGASDCRCAGHLVHLPALPDETWVARTLGAERTFVGNVELDELLTVLRSGTDESRETAALALGRFGAVAVEPLAALLAGGDADARWWAARALAEVGGDNAVAALVRVLADPDPDLRACAALALGRIGNASAAPTLAGCLGDESAFVAGVAADALSMIGDPAVDALAAKLTASSPHIRLLAVRALARIKSKRAIGPLFELLEDPSYLVRHYAHEALETCGRGNGVRSSLIERLETGNGGFMAGINVKWTGGAQFLAADEAGHVVVTDKEGQGFKPPDLLLVSLVGCAGVDVVQHPGEKTAKVRQHRGQGQQRERARPALDHRPRSRSSGPCGVGDSSTKPWRTRCGWPRKSTARCRPA